MSLINASYFKGPLTIAQLGQDTVTADLNLFISQNEGVFMQAALGYDLWNDFITGLSQPVIDQKWIDLRDGATFTTVNNWPAWYWGDSWFNKSWYFASQRTARWVGFANGSTSITTGTASQPVLSLVTDAGAGNPVSGTNVFTLATLAGTTYWVERRGFGTLIPGTDVTISNNGQTITLISTQFNPNEVYFIHFTSSSNSGTAGQTYVSPIACYIYYLYQQDLFQQQTGIGVVRNKGQYSDPGNPTRKMVDAWNTMSQNIFILWQFLQAQGTSVYANYDQTKMDFLMFRPKNVFSI